MCLHLNLMDHGASTRVARKPNDTRRARPFLPFLPASYCQKASGESTQDGEITG